VINGVLVGRRNAAEIRQIYLNDPTWVFDLSKVRVMAYHYADELFGVLAMNHCLNMERFPGATPYIRGCIEQAVENRLGSKDKDQGYVLSEPPDILPENSEGKS
jgi:hypothetical protein